MEEMKYLSELAVQDYYFSTQRASTIALAAILNAISDTCTKERREVLEAFLHVITECSNFDDSEQITAARRRLRLHSLTKPKPDTDTEQAEITADERSLDESVKTLKASNSSSQQRKSESHCWHERDGLGHEHIVSSPQTSSVHDILVRRKPWERE